MIKFITNLLKYGGVKVIHGVSCFHQIQMLNEKNATENDKGITFSLYMTSVSCFITRTLSRSGVNADAHVMVLN